MVSWEGKGLAGLGVLGCLVLGNEKEWSGWAA